MLQKGGVAAGLVQDAEDLTTTAPQPIDWRPPPSYPGETNFAVWTEFGGLDIDEIAEGIVNGLFT